MKIKRAGTMKVLLLSVTISIFSCKKEKVEDLKGETKVETKADPRIDTRGLDQYIRVAETLADNKEPAQVEWDSLFRTVFYNRYNEFGVLKKEDEQKRMRQVYQQSDASPSGERDQHLEYKKKLPELKKFSTSLKDGSVIAEAQKYVLPMLPERLQGKPMPGIKYAYNVEPEALGSDNPVIQDALLSYNADGYVKGLLTAHEAFHYITIAATFDRLKVPLDDPRVTLAFPLLNISQEGMADLIDKDIFLKQESPLREFFGSLASTPEEEQLSKRFIESLNAVLEKASKGEEVPDASELRKTIMAQGGHQPGRYMGKLIKQAGLLNEVIAEVDNPFQFFFSYNKAASQSSGKYPVFSTAAIGVLEKLEMEIITPLNPK
ncbi:MAG TPA: DUF5700 domain-containing putative Zn-dependent protease [Cytophagaceae bacterium]